MNDQQLLAEIRELNLSYLILAQNLVRRDAAEGCFRLGLSEASAARLAALTVAQLARVASSSQLLCRARFDDDMVWDLLSDHGRSRPAAGMHAAILMAGRVAEAA